MGKQAQLRKKRRMERELAEAQAISNKKHNPGPSAEPVAGTSNGNEAESTDMDTVTSHELSVTTSTLMQLVRSPALLKTKKFKVLRKVLFDLGVSTGGGTKTSSGRVSEMIQNHAWDSALTELAEMKARNEKPKLGSLQRWVRECDAAGVSDSEALRVLDAMLRVTSPDLVSPVLTEPFKLLPNGVVRRYDEFTPFPEPQCVPTPEADGIRIATDEDKKVFTPLFTECAHVKGTDRKPANKYDLTIYSSSPPATPEAATLILNPSSDHKISRLEIPNVPGGFVMTNVFTQEECKNFLRATESIGYAPDEPLAGQPGDSILAHAVVWVVDKHLDEIVFNRVKSLLPSSIQSKQLRGINRRWRFYRYVPGRYYRPHIDGAWPQSAIDDNSGAYIYDASHGTQLSKLTFLIYFNDDFDGGWTTYYTSAQDEGYLNAWPVKPRSGCVVCFPHGDAEGALLHEGSPVLERCKYVVRTEVLYEYDGTRV
eukprot:GFYU01007039.1.p1 GENE.GFYU01007039.1~~GFYU01007039.1.p1  ORF type:complete len:483 (+),score=110.42 GFYU01007039.1:98-1546(+)